jgi:hypothetical protein
VAADQPLHLGLLRRIQEPLLVRPAPALAADQPRRSPCREALQMSNTPVRVSPVCAATAA